MFEEQELATKIIDVIRHHPEWKTGHQIIDFNGIEIGYYDTREKGRYFYLKHNGIEFNNKQDSYQIEYKEGRQQTNFDLMEWLKGMYDVVTAPPPKPNDMNASEAVYGLMAWLTTRKGGELTLGPRHLSGPAAEAAKLFCETNNLEPVREDKYPANLTHPK